jgi:hypothetical protein
MSLADHLGFVVFLSPQGIRLGGAGRPEHRYPWPAPSGET